MNHQKYRSGVILLGALLAGGERLTAQGTAADSQAIRTLIQAHATAWNNRDSKAAAAIMTPDGIWITSSGVTLHGRAEVERQHVQWFAVDSAAGGSTHLHPPESITIRFLRRDVAVADLEGQFVGRPGPDGKPPAPERGLLFIVLSKDAGDWRIAHVRNTGMPR